jgi:hypothetical protein
MSRLPGHLGQAFLMAAGELGMASAARLFVRELAQLGGDELVAEACDAFGREYPVLDFVAHQWLEGHRAFRLDPSDVRSALAGITRLVVVGLETDALDVLVSAIPGVEVGLVAEPFGVAPDMRRVLANFDALRWVDLADYRRWAGKRSALLTFVYGTDGHAAHVAATWLRVLGPDVRAQFRSLIGWDVLGQPMRLYPRWLVETSCDDFSVICRQTISAVSPNRMAEVLGS